MRRSHHPESNRAADLFVAHYFFRHFLCEEAITRLALANEDAKTMIMVLEAGAIDNATYLDSNKADVLNASGAPQWFSGCRVTCVQKGRCSATYCVIW